MCPKVFNIPAATDLIMIKSPWRATNFKPLYTQQRSNKTWQKRISYVTSKLTPKSTH